jgi:hypothetical protein
MLHRLWSAMLKAAPVRFWALVAAGPVFTFGVAMLTLLTWLGDMTAKPVELAEKRLDYIGISLIACVLMLGIIVVAVAAVKVRGTGPGGVSLEVAAADHEEEDQHG